MDEAADAARGRGGEHRQRAGDIALLEAAASGALITPATWMTASAPLDQPSSASRSSRSPATQVDAVARRLLAAGQRADLVPGGERGVDQMRADEAGAAGDRQAS